MTFFLNCTACHPLTGWYNPRLKCSSVPPEIGELSSLVDLDLSGNCLESLPPQLGQLGHLTSLTVASNRLTSLPGELGNLSELQALNVANNLLTSLDGLKLEGLTRLKSLNAEVGKVWIDIRTRRSVLSFSDRVIAES